MFKFYIFSFYTFCWKKEKENKKNKSVNKKIVRKNMKMKEYMSVKGKRVWKLMRENSVRKKKCKNM